MSTGCCRICDPLMPLLCYKGVLWWDSNSLKKREKFSCLGLLSMAQQWEVLLQRERQAHEVGHKDPGAAPSSCAWAERSLPFLLSYMSWVHSLHLLYISFFKLLWKRSRLFPALYKSRVIFVLCYVIHLNSQACQAYEWKINIKACKV